MAATRNSHSPAISAMLSDRPAEMADVSAALSLNRNNSIQLMVPKNSVTLALLMWMTSSNMTPSSARTARIIRNASRADIGEIPSWFIRVEAGGGLADHAGGF